MAPILYTVSYSQPVRATLMTIKALKINVEIREISLKDGQQHNSNFLKINPQHTVPTLVEDDGFILWESHAIMPYLVDKYGTNDFLYPKDLKKRAMVNQRLHFNNGVVFPLNILRPIIYENVASVPQEKLNAVEEAYSFMEKFLEGNEWISGDFLSIADFALISTISSLDIVVPVSTNYPNVGRWMKEMEKLDCYEENRKGLEVMREMIEEKLRNC